ncbi:hypothetical protein [Adonisia turfae]|uniref:hypothetical protein n=1 Tax=Adonisia turfae TaxID=2950184 RepID=UPI0013D0920E|nr:hypothetical protein [Adonisia turfae]
MRYQLIRLFYGYIYITGRTPMVHKIFVIAELGDESVRSIAIWRYLTFKVIPSVSNADV